MPIIKPKSPEQLQAQVEYFADVGIGEFSNTQKILLQNAHILATLNKQHYLENPSLQLPKKLREIIKFHASRTSDLLWERSNFYEGAYTQVLRENDRQVLKDRQRYTEIYKNEFQEIVDTLKAEIKEKWENYENHLGSGMNGSAFVFDGKDGKKYVAKISRIITQANFELAPLLQSRCIKNTSQLQAYWAPEGIAIMDFIPGKDISQTEFGTPNYTRAQMKALIQTVIDLYENGLIIDPHPSNIIYHKTNGFSVIDFNLKGEELDVSIEEVLLGLEENICHFSYKSTTQENIKKAPLISHERYLKNMIQFLELLEKDFPGRVQNFYEQQQVKKQKLPGLKQPKTIFEKEYLETFPELIPYFDRLKALGVE